MVDYNGPVAFVYILFFSPVALYFLCLGYFVAVVATYIEFFYFLFAGRRCFRRGRALIGSVLILFAAVMLSGLDGMGILVAGLCGLALWLYVTWRTRPSPIWLEWVVNGALSAGLGVDILMGYERNISVDWVLGFAPMGLNLILLLVDNLLPVRNTGSG